MMRPTLILFLTLIVSCLSEVLRGKNVRRKLEETCVALIQAVNMGPDQPEEEYLVCETPTGMIYKVKNASKKDLDHVKKNIGKANVDTVLQFASVAHINEETQEIESETPPTLMEQMNPSSSRRLATVTGNKSILVVRVVTSDNKAPSASRLSLSSSVFSNNADGNGADPVSIKTQYAACSHGKLNIVEANDRNGSGGVNIRYGSVQVKISQSSSKDNGTIRNAVTSQLQTLFGVNAWQLADHVMYCLPPLSTNWGIAYAYINSWNSVYSNEWCRYLSTQMHEIGHNMNLAHAGETAEYDDQSGMMGYSYADLNGPLMCFNAAKSWQLGWYSPRHLTLNLNKGFSGFLGSIVHDDSDPSPAIIKVNNSGSTTDYYITFNWKYGMNSGTVEGGNQVMVVETGSEGSGYSKSLLRGKQSVGSNTYTLGSQKVTVTVNSIDTTNGYANVDICYGSCVKPPTSAPTLKITSSPSVSVQPSRKPSMAPTAIPTSRPTGSPTFMPSKEPSSTPSASPTGHPTFMPSTEPSLSPSVIPSTAPSLTPSVGPTVEPTFMPSDSPSLMPSFAPSASVIKTVHSFIKADLVVSCPFNETLVEESLTSDMVSSLEQEGISVRVAVTLLGDVSCSGRRNLDSHNVETVIETYVLIRSENYVNITSDTVVSAAESISTVSSASLLEQPSSSPSTSPSATPSSKPSDLPSVYPTVIPSTTPTRIPSTSPSRLPTTIPSDSPSNDPTVIPSTTPTRIPSTSPSRLPTTIPSNSPSNDPTVIPSTTPTRIPTTSPSKLPSEIPSMRPSKKPSASPSATPSQAPTPASWKLCRTVNANKKINNCINISGCTWCASCSVASGKCRPITPAPTASPSSRPTVSPSDLPSVSVVATVVVTLKVELGVTCPFNPTEASGILNLEASSALQQNGVSVQIDTSIDGEACSGRRILSSSDTQAIMQVVVLIRDDSISGAYDNDYIVNSILGLDPVSFSVNNVEIIESPSASPSSRPTLKPTRLTASPSFSPTTASTPSAYKVCRSANAIKKENKCTRISNCIWTNNSCYHIGSKNTGAGIGPPVSAPVTAPISNSCASGTTQKLCKNNKACQWASNRCTPK